MVIKRIKSIDIFTNVCLNKDIKKKEFYTFLIVSMENDSLVYNLNNGKDYSKLKQKNIAIIDGLTVKRNLYKFDNRQYQAEMDFSELQSIQLYKNARLINKYNEYSPNYSMDLIEFKDSNNNTFFISHHLNKIFIRNNIFDIKNKNKCKCYTIFKKNANNNLDFKILDSIKFNILKLFFDFV